MFLAFGVVCALLEAQKSGKGQVVDAAMVDGAAYLAAGIYGLYSQGSWADERGVNVIDSGAPWYDVYKTKDGKYLSVGAIEKRFYAELLEKLGLAKAELPKQHDRKGWPELRRRFTEAIAAKTRDEWAHIFAESDACVAPVLAFGEVEAYPHNAARGTFRRRDGVLQPAPAPRYSRTQCEMGPPGRPRGADSEAVLRDWGFASAEVAQLAKAGVVGAA
jgi:alpha-methylacyl-CoA racemase